MSKIISKIYPIPDFLYLLQLEEYESKRYFRLLKRFFWRRSLQKRGQLKYTKRVKLTLCLALPFCILVPPLIPLWVGISNVILNPYFEWIKTKIQKRATLYFKQKNTKTKVIAIAGSYGKTTTKNYIYELVKYNYKTQMIPGNINTPAGIAFWILNEFEPNSELLIVEVDTYFVGEIKRSLTITPPDIAILTNVGDQHLERLGTKKNLEKALTEVFKYSKKDSIKIKDKASNLDCALEVAKILKIPQDIIKDTTSKLRKPDRRGDIKIMNGFEVIDESYNISVSTAKISIDNALKAARLKKKKLLVITAGIPELGIENIDGNNRLGVWLTQKADKIILLKSILYKEVLNSSSKFKVVNDLNEAWNLLEKMDSNKYLVLLQPELNDLYY